jgi:hypothetical protein
VIYVLGAWCVLFGAVDLYTGLRYDSLPATLIGAMLLLWSVVLVAIVWRQERRS